MTARPTSEHLPQNPPFLPQPEQPQPLDLPFELYAGFLQHLHSHAEMNQCEDYAEQIFESQLFWTLRSSDCQGAEDQQTKSRIKASSGPGLPLKLSIIACMAR